MGVILMPKKKAQKKTHKIKIREKKAARQTHAIAFSKQPQPSKFRLVFVLLFIIALGYWLFSTKKVEISTKPGSTVQQTGGSLVSPSPEITWETYTVKQGDNIRGIALQVYGDANAWVKIVQANNLKNPNSIHAGNVLRIPR